MFSSNHGDWRQLPQDALDSLYDQTAHAKNMHEVLAGYSAASRVAREIAGVPIRRAYGAAPSEQLDWFQGPAGGPISIFVHGGAWRAGTASQYHFPATAFQRAGAHFVVLDFDSVLNTDGDLLPMVQQVRNAVAWVAKNAKAFGADPDAIFISSHSSGSHIAACVVQTDWSGLHGLPEDLIKGVLYCGGIYELEPVFASSRRRYLKLTDSVIQDLSPIRHLKCPLVPSIVAYGEWESGEFIRQSIEYADKIRSLGGQVELIEGKGFNHFEILTTLGDSKQLLGRTALEQMGLNIP